MTEKTQPTPTLTPGQRQLVRDNLGLVAVHLSRNVPNLAAPRRDREWEDLFQEGCLGLIRAAVAYRRERGIPFPAFALPRIHNAVTVALQTKFSNVYVPPRKKRKGFMLMGRKKCGNPRRHPREPSSPDELADRLPDRGGQSPDRPDGYETVGDRLRHKYERAVRRARNVLSERASRRGDRAELLDILERERFLVPSEEAKHPLRRIAQQTNSSFGRVALYEKQMSDTVREILEGDPEFIALKRRARANPRGVDDPIDEDVESDLARSTAGEFVKRFRTADVPLRARMLTELLGAREQDLDEIIERCFASLEADERARVLSFASSSNH